MSRYLPENLFSNTESLPFAECEGPSFKCLEGNRQNYSFVNFSVSPHTPNQYKISPTGPMAVNYMPISQSKGTRFGLSLGCSIKSYSWTTTENPNPLTQKTRYLGVSHDHFHPNRTDYIRRTLLTDLVLACALHHWSSGALEHLTLSLVACWNCASRGKASTSYTVPHSPLQHPRRGTGENHDQLGYWLIDWLITWLTGLLKGWMDGWSSGWSAVHRPGYCWL